MLLSFEFNDSVVRVRGSGSTEERVEFPALMLGNKWFALPTNSDVDEGDLLEWTNPAGREKVYRVTEVNFYNHPDMQPGPGSLNHTEVRAADTLAVQPEISGVRRIDIEGLHTGVSQASGATYASGHYTEAVFNAFKAVETRVQSLSPVSASGKRLMGQTFGSSPPKLDVSVLPGENAGNEREGYNQIFMGVMQAIRDTRAHGESVKDSRDEAFEYLALASILMRRLDVAESKLSHVET